MSDEDSPPTRRQALGAVALSPLALALPAATAASIAPLPDDADDFVITANGWVIRRDDLRGA